MKLANRINKFSEYVFSSLLQLAKEVEQSSGIKVLNLAVGNPSFSPSRKYINKFKEFIDKPNAHYYPGYKATDKFQKSLIFWYKKRFNVQIKNSQLYPLLGSKDGISHLSLALLNKGDEVLIPNPGYPAYINSCLVVGARPVFYNLIESNNFKISLKEIENKITSKTKLIWLNFPSNPTGQVVTKCELEKLVKLAKKKKIVLAYDSAYSEITFDNFKAPSILEISKACDVAIEFGSLSKTFSLAGYRIGFVVGNQTLISALAKIKSQFDSGLSLPLQDLASFCLSNFDYQWHQNMLDNYYKRAKIIAVYLRKLGLKFNLPKASLYIWAKIPDDCQNSEEYCLRLLKEKQILLTPGTAFGSNGNRYVRISISSNIESIHEYFK